MQIPALETGVLRLFSVNLPEPEIVDFAAGDALRAALGADTLDPAKVEVFPVKDLSDLGLPGYLTEGQGIPEDQVTPMRAQLQALKGHVLILPSTALGDAAQTLRPKAPLIHIGTFFEDHPPVTFDPLPDESAKPQTPEAPEEGPRKQLSDAAIGGRVAMVALLVAFAVAAMMVWLA